MMRELVNQYKGGILWIAILTAFLFSRLFHLTLIPIFTDEAIYLRWSQIMSNDIVYKFLPLSDGKPPLFMWAAASLMHWFSFLDPLVLGRLVSVGAGLLALAGIYFASLQLFNSKRIGYLAAIVYLICPFTLFYDRFALADSLLAAWGIWSLGLTARLTKKPRLKIAILLGVVNGLGLLTKVPAVFFLLFTPLFILLIERRPDWRNIIKLITYPALSAAISLAIFSYLFTLPDSYLIFKKDEQFVIPLGEFLKFPFRLLPGNIHALLQWEASYLTISFVVLLALSGILFLRRHWRQKILIWLIFLGYLISLASFNKIIYPRFLLIFTSTLLILVALAIDETIKITPKKLVIPLVLLVFIFPLKVDYTLLTDPPRVQIADNDSFHYLNGWPAGYGVNQVRDFLAEKSRENPAVIIWTEGTFGLMPFSLQLYQDRYPNLKIESYWPPSDVLSKEILESARKEPTYILIYQRENFKPQNGTVKLIQSHRQGSGTSYLKLYEIIKS